MRLGDFDALSFDCYGTLIDWEQGILTELKPWAAPAGLADDAILETFGAEESRCEAATPDKPYPGVLADVYRALGRRWGLPVNEVAPIAFGGSVGRWPAFPDSADALAYLKEHYRLVILSNVDRVSFMRSNAKLQVEFDLVLTAQDIGAYKPDQRNFDRLLAEVGALGVEKPRLLHVAQSLFHDIAPARALGLSTVWVNRRRGKPGGGATPPASGDATPDLEVASLAELAERHRAGTA
ncbi:MAG TPA: haloacid dehalogenase type II [Candidatus Sulfotelmatobacter sp.]|nr:haloacid dehalogenase type II [Candidatus Sulfotelmatobacter sp.]